MPVRVIAGIKTLKEVDPVSTDIWVVTDTRVPISVLDRKSTRLNSSHLGISYAVFCLKKEDCTDEQSGPCPEKRRFQTANRQDRFPRYAARSGVVEQVPLRPSAGCHGRGGEHAPGRPQPPSSTHRVDHHGAHGRESGSLRRREDRSRPPGSSVRIPVPQVPDWIGSKDFQPRRDEL